LVHSVKVLDDTFEEISGQTTEEQIYYGVFVGSRWLQRTADSGLTVDAYMGLGMGLRNYNKNYRDNEQLDDSFDSIIKKRGFFPVLMGLNIGFVGPKRRQTK